MVNLPLEDYTQLEHDAACFHILNRNVREAAREFLARINLAVDDRLLETGGDLIVKEIFEEAFRFLAE